MRDYQVEGQLGLEPTPEEYVANMVSVFREVWRVLRPDGTLWLNLGDSYATGNSSDSSNSHPSRHRKGMAQEAAVIVPIKLGGLKPKDLVGVPWRVAFALQDDGWYLRSDIIWAKPNPMPESVTDRPTKAHEYVFLLTKQARYYYDADAIREPASDWGTRDRTELRNGTNDPLLKHRGLKDGNFSENGRNKRTVWTVSTRSYKGAHYATFPPDLVQPMVLAGAPAKCCAVCRAPWERVVERNFAGEYNRVASEDQKRRSNTMSGGTERVTLGRQKDVLRETTGWQPTCNHEGTQPALVLDPFCGSGTLGEVCRMLPEPRAFIGFDISHEYLSTQAIVRSERQTPAKLLKDLPMFEDIA